MVSIHQKVVVLQDLVTCFVIMHVMVSVAYFACEEEFEFFPTQCQHCH